MKIAPHTVVSAAYELHENGPTGELLEVMDIRWPLWFLFGSGQLIPAFEDHLAGLQSGDRFSFTLGFHEAYGPVRESEIRWLSKTDFLRDGEYHEAMLEEGNYVTVSTAEGRMNGRIVADDGQRVRIDFNHGMAGKNLHFKGEILHVRKATPDELVANHYIEPDGVHF